MTRFRLSHHLEPGDTIVQPGFIPLHVTDVNKSVAGWVIAYYHCAATHLIGARTYPEGQVLTVQPRAIQEAH